MTLNIRLEKGIAQSVHSVEVEFLGVETRYFEPPMETRSRIHFFFRTRYEGRTENLKYSEGFPGGLSPKPSLKIGPRRFLNFDWKEFSETTIDMIFEIKERDTCVDGQYEFAQCSIGLAVHSSEAVWKTEALEEHLQLFPEEMREALRTKLQSAILKTYAVLLKDRSSQKEYNFLLSENILYLPYIIPTEDLGYRVRLQKEGDEFLFQVLQGNA